MVYAPDAKLYLVSVVDQPNNANTHHDFVIHKRIDQIVWRTECNHNSEQGYAV